MCCADYNKYSILMSVYYKEKPEWLDISIQSMLNQTVKADEFVIVKDGKLTKELDDVISNYAEQYPQLFNIIELEKNEGLGPALNAGIRQCRNELVARMDSDDYSCDKRCEKQLKFFKNNPDYDIVGTYEVEFEDHITNKISIHKVSETSDEIYEKMKRRCSLLHPTVMYKKSSVLKCGGYKKVHLYEDYDLFMRMVVERKMKSYNIQENLYYIRINDDFYKRRGGIKYMKTVVAFKYKQMKKGYMSLCDFIVSAGGQAFVCLLPNTLRKAFYMKFLR